MGKGPVLFDGITGDLYVNVKGVFSGGGGTSSLFGAAFPASGTALGFESAGGLMVPLVLTAGGEVPVSGTFGGTADETVFAAGVTEGSPLMGYDPTSGELLVAQPRSRWNVQFYSSDLGHILGTRTNDRWRYRWNYPGAERRTQGLCRAEHGDHGDLPGARAHSDCDGLFHRPAGRRGCQ
jgi:hypothetical protein